MEHLLTNVLKHAVNKAVDTIAAETGIASPVDRRTLRGAPC